MSHDAATHSSGAPMPADRWQEIRECFDAAVALPPEDRPAYLREACAGDDALAAEVRALLDADERAAERLGHAVRDAAVLAAAATAAGQQSMEGRRIGPWRLVRQLGRGGMGDVFLAERVDGAFTQQVALKLVRRGLESSPLEERFHAERRILARLEHPCIARLVDGGVTSDGQPWYAMELVEGDPIDRHCDARGLDVDARLRLFADVCRAVMFAHSRLVVHRDLKPDHILVTPRGEVRLLDFGIAKLLDDTGDAARTSTGMRLMTPGYASPEQVRGEPVGTSSDIYSLGVVLYELLTGSHPYDLAGKSLGEVERIVSQTMPERPSTRVTDTGRRRRALRGDLDMICLEALRKEPDRRYGSVEALLEDITRHLNGRPVLARPDTLRYRVRKFVTRNRAGVVIGTAALVLLAAVTGVYLRSLAAERDHARAEASTAEAVASFLQGIFTINDPGESRGEKVTARELLDAGAARIDTGLADQPAVQATMMLVVGDVYRSLGMSSRGLPLIAGALERTRRLHGDDAPETATAALSLAEVNQEVGNLSAADTLMREALAIRREHFPPPSPEVSEAVRALASLVELMGDDREAERLLRDALAEDRALYPPNDVHIGNALSRLGALDRRLHNYPEAEAFLREGLAIQRRAYGDTVPRVTSTMRNLASLLRDQHRYAESESLYVETIDLLHALYGPVHPDLALALNSYAIMLDDAGRPDRAIAMQRQVIDQFDRIYGGPHSNTAAAYYNLASALRSQKRYAEAEAAYLKCREIQLAVLPPGHRDLARPWQGLGNLRRDQKRFAEADTMFRRALRIRRAVLPRGHSQILETLHSLLRDREDLGDSAGVKRIQAEIDAESRHRPA